MIENGTFRSFKTYVTGELYAFWLSAGANMIGVGSALYKPGDMPDDIQRHASSLKAAAQEHRRGNA